MTYPFVLGTAQFGSHYGITNTSGAPSDDDVQELLNYCLTKGINLLDTASAYGNSLERISNFCSKKKDVHIDIINKFSVKDDFYQIYENLLNTLKNSGLKKFYGLLIHDPANLKDSNQKHLISFLEKIKRENIVEKIGVSIYVPEDLKTILDVYPFELIQCPLNIFDQQLLASPLFHEFKKRNMEIHARSLFLQGVLLAPNLPETIKDLDPLWKAYKYALHERDLKPLQFIMSWVKSIKGVDKWVVGVNKKKELSEILQAYDECKEDLDYNWSIFNAPYLSNVNPRNWTLK